jgi:hypothetical protein
MRECRSDRVAVCDDSMILNVRRVFEEVIAQVTDQSGPNIPGDQLEFDIYDNPRGRPNCQGKIAYRGPVSPASGGWPKIKLDLTADERLVLV